VSPEEIKLIEEAAGVIIPWVIQKLFDTQIINAEQKLVADSLVETEQLLGELKAEAVFPTDKNGQFEEREPSASNINREDVTS
jgi:hypothetical protein